MNNYQLQKTVNIVCLKKNYMEVQFPNYMELKIENYFLHDSKISDIKTFWMSITSWIAFFYGPFFVGASDNISVKGQQSALIILYSHILCPRGLQEAHKLT